MTERISQIQLIRGLLAAMTAGFLFLFSGISTDASMDPAEINRINQHAPYHLIVSVTKDELIEELSDSTPSQLRRMTVELVEINRSPHNRPLRSMEITYTYIPPWVERDGGSQMDIAVGDVIEVWLEEGKSGLEPAAWGDSIHHIYYSPNRPEHIPEPFASKVGHAGKAFLKKPHTVGNAVVATVFVGLFLVLAVAGVRRRRFSNKKSAV